jgi:hypothetical protein
LGFHFGMNPTNDPQSNRSSSIDHRSIIFLLLPSLGFLGIAITLIATGNRLHDLLTKPLFTQRELDARYGDIERRLSECDPTLTPERVVGMLRTGNRTSESMKSMGADIAGSMRTVGFWALLPVALQVYVIVRVTRPLKKGPF